MLHRDIICKESRARAHWLRRLGGRGFTLVTWRNYVVTYRFVLVKRKFLILFNRILVSDATKQMTHDGLVWHANIYVPQLKCQHLGCALVLTFQLRDIYISMWHLPWCVMCIVLMCSSIADGSQSCVSSQSHAEHQTHKNAVTVVSAIFRAATELLRQAQACYGIYLYVGVTCHLTPPVWQTVTTLWASPYLSDRGCQVDNECCAKPVRHSAYWRDV